MKRLLIIAALVAVAFSANAQVFDFSNNNNRYEFGLTLGQAGSFTQYADFGMGLSAMVWGGYIDFIKSDAQHKYDNHVSDTTWNDTEAFSINLGYQIPILRWLRVMPLVGYSQTNEGITDGSTVNISSSENSGTMYHDYDVTPGSRKHYFSYGAGLSVQPLRWFSINAVVTSKAIYGGISLNFLAFAM